MAIVKPESGAFLYIGDVVTKIFEINSTSSPFATASSTIQGFASVLQATAISYITIWILYEAFQIILGVKQTSLTTFLWNLTMKVIVISLFINYGNFISLFKSAVGDVMNYASNFAFGGGNWSSWQKIQAYMDSIVKLIAKMIDDASWWSGEKIIAGISGLLGLAGGLIGALSLASALSIVSITNSILIIITPLMFAFLLLKTTKQVFSQYISLLISNFLALLFINVFASASIQFVMSLTQENVYGKTPNIILVVISCIVSGVILRTGTTLALQLAQQLSSVSLDSAVKSAQTSTSLGALATAGATAKLGYMSRLLPKGMINQTKKEFGAMKTDYQKAKNAYGKTKGAYNKIKDTTAKWRNNQ